MIIETPDDMITLIKKAMNQLKLKKHAYIELKKTYCYQINNGSKVKATAKEQETSPRWFVRFYYPRDQAETPKTFTVRTKKGKYETEEQLVAFIVRMIQKYTTI